MKYTLLDSAEYDAVCWQLSNLPLADSAATMLVHLLPLCLLMLLMSQTLCMQAACLEARNREPSAGFNELALSLLDVLRALGSAATQATPPQTQARLLRALCGVLRQAGNAPLRLRTAAAHALGALASCEAFAPTIADALAGAHWHYSPTASIFLIPVRSYIFFKVIYGDSVICTNVSQY